MPTITRNAQNTGATGGMSSPNSSSPCTSPSASCVRMSESAFGTVTAKSLRRFSWSGKPMSVSGAPRSVCHSASIAAIFAGWCSSVFRPCRSPTTIWIGTRTAATCAAKRRVLRADGSSGAFSRRQAESPATRNDAVMPEASSMCVRRYGNEGLKITSSQLAAMSSPSCTSWPAGVCIHELSARIQNADTVVPNATTRRGQDVHPSGHAVHAEEHHAEKRRLEEERGEHLVRKERPGDVADAVHVARPVGAELEAHHHARTRRPSRTRARTPSPTACRCRARPDRGSSRSARGSTSSIHASPMVIAGNRI